MQTQASPYEAANGCVYRTFSDGRPRQVVASFYANGRAARAFACASSQRMAELAAASLNESSVHA